MSAGRHFSLATICSTQIALFSPAGADTPCHPRSDVVTQLSIQYGEQPVARGLTAAGQMVEVFASPSGTFTIVVTRHDSLSCLIAAGKGWHAIATNKES